MAAFGKNLIEHSRTRLVGVQPQNQFREKVDWVREEFDYQRERENAANGRADCPLPLVRR
jgi:hypothetical protein